MLLLEIIITILFYLFLPFYFVERVIHKKSHGWKEKFAYVKEFTKEDKVIHIHCCSVGEALAIENLLKSIRANFPENKNCSNDIYIRWPADCTEKICGTGRLYYLLPF